jgi:TIR domain
MPTNGNQPQIFVSFAGEDRPTAYRLAADLSARGVRSFIDATSVEAGENIVEAIDKALNQSDFFVLLWSARTVGRSWVTAEWTAALTRGLNERRSFLYVVRLDDTPVPTMLAPHKYLDAFADWDAAVARLARAWNIDRSMGIPVLPTPAQPARPSGADAIEVYVRNRSLSVSHKVPAVPATATGPALLDLISADLKLPDRVSDLDRIVATRTNYLLEFTGRPVTERPLAEQGITDDSTVDLVVSVDLVSDGKTLSTWALRTEDEPIVPAGLTVHEVKAIINGAFSHLRPW